MVEPKGGGDKLFDHLMPRIEEVAVADAVRDRLTAAGVSVAVAFVAG